MPNPRLPGTSYISRLLAGRFQIVDPKASGSVAPDVQPVYVVGGQSDETGLGCRAVTFRDFSIAVVARNSFMGFEWYDPRNELVLHSLTVRAFGANLAANLYVRAQGPMQAGSVPTQLMFAEGGLVQQVPLTTAIMFVGDAAALPAQLATDSHTVLANSEVTHTYPGGIITRVGGALQLMNAAQNNGLEAVWRFTMRPATG